MFMSYLVIAVSLTSCFMMSYATGLAVSLMMEATSMDSVYAIFDRFCLQIECRLKKSDRHYEAARSILSQVKKLLSQARDDGVNIHLATNYGLNAYIIGALSRSPEVMEQAKNDGVVKKIMVKRGKK